VRRLVYRVGVGERLGWQVGNDERLDADGGVPFTDGIEVCFEVLDWDVRGRGGESGRREGVHDCFVVVDARKFDTVETSVRNASNECWCRFTEVTQ
jgi:hypothetical protein